MYLKVTHVRKVLSLLLQLSDLLSTKLSLHLLGILEHLLHSLTLALLADVLELIAALLEDLALLLLTTTVVFEGTLTLLEVHATLVELFLLELLSTLRLLCVWDLVVDGGGDDGCVGRSKGYKGCKGECKNY